MVYLYLLIGFICLIYGGEILVTGSVKLARRIGVSPLLIGLTLVGFGTSTPELITSLLAAFRGASDIAVGNVIGSNIANILLVLGVAAVINPIHVDIKSFRRDSTFLALSSIGLILAVYIGTIHFLMGLALVGSLIFYVAYSYVSDRHNQKDLKEKEKSLPTADTQKYAVMIALIQTIGGIALTLLGAKLLVDNSIILATKWHVSKKVIGLTVVAVGTSLPELITSVMAGIHKQNDVAFGNVVGSNIYNALFILGMTALFISVSISKSMTTDLWIMVATTAVLIGIAFWKKCFTRSVGVLFLLAYAVYVWGLFK